MAEQKIRLLIAEDSAAWRSTLRGMLEGCDEVEVVGEATDGPKAVAAAVALRPDVMVVDMCLPGMDGAQVTETVRAQFPATAVIIVSVESRPEDFRRAIRAGARDYLVKPFSADELLAAVRAAAGGAVESLALPQTASGALTVVFFGPSGVGKSTLAVNLSAWMALRGRTTVLMDLDLEFGVSAQLMGVQPRATIVDLCRRDGELSDETVLKALTRGASGLPALLAPPPQPHLAAEVDGEGRRDPGRQYVAEIISRLRRLCDYLVVDTQSTFREATLAALDAAHVIMVVVTAEVPSLYRAGKILDILLGQLGYPAEKVRLVVNRYDPQRSIKIEQIATGMDHPVSFVIPADEPAVLAASDRGQPFILRRRRSEVVRALIKMGESLVGPAPREAPSASSQEAPAAGRTAEQPARAPAPEPSPPRERSAGRRAGPGWSLESILRVMGGGT